MSESTRGPSGNEVRDLNASARDVDAPTVPASAPPDPRQARQARRALDPAARDVALRAVLDRDPTALVFALDSAAVRVPVPEDADLCDRTELPGQSTVMDYVVAADRMAVVDAWERAVATGYGQEQVQIAGQPETSFTVTLVDCRHRHGTWVGVLSADGGPASTRSGAVSRPGDPAVLVPSRPRTATLQKNLAGVITDVDDRGIAMLGWSRTEMVGRRSLEFIHPDDHERAIGQWLEMRATQTSQRVRVRHRHREGHWLWVEVENVFVGLEQPDERVAVATLTDISDEMAAHEAVRAREQLFHRLTESLPVGVLQLDADHRILYANPCLSQLLGSLTPTGVGTSVDAVVESISPHDRPSVCDALTAAIVGEIDSTVEVDLDPGRGQGALPVTARQCRVQLTIAALPSTGGRAGAIVSVTDITEGARLREELRIKATYDPLTGCLTRAAVIGELETRLAADRESLAVVYVDLVRFKAVNDAHGHPVGDDLLALAGRRLLAQARREDAVGRLGGDEFLAVCPWATEPRQAIRVAQRVYDHLHDEVTVGGHRLLLAASVGVTVAGPGIPPDLVLSSADQAMYEAKRRGSGPVFRPLTADHGLRRGFRARRRLVPTSGLEDRPD